MVTPFKSISASAILCAIANNFISAPEALDICMSLSLYDEASCSVSATDQLSMTLAKNEAKAFAAGAMRVDG